MKKTGFFLVLGLAVIVLFAVGSVLAKENPDFSKVVGTWKIDVYGGGASYRIDLAVTENQGQLEGKVSESTGTFTDVPISEIFYDSASFRFQFVASTPPDGMSRTVSADFKVVEGTMTGTISVPDLNFVGDATATRQN